MKIRLLTFALLVACGLGQLPAAEQPNVLIILGDDQAWGDFGFMGNKTIQTPNLDRLASEGLTFTRGYVPSSLCRPSLATLVTGLYPHQHRITSNDPARKLPKAEFLAQRQRMIDNIDRVPTLPRLLAEREYKSLQTGKWWEGNFSRGGFTEGMTHGDPKRGGRHGDQGLKIGREGLGPITDFLDKSDNRPFFIWYAPFLPHRPHNPPQRLLDKYVDKTDSIHVARYWAMCEWFDETCGQLLDYLDRKKLADNTLVVFLGDNGWIQKTDSSGYAPKSKRSQYDGGLRTPVVLRWPGHIEPSRDEQTPVLSTDVAPTILSACGMKPTAEMQGIDVLDGKRLARRKAIFGEVFLHNAVDIDDPATSLEYRWCIEGNWKLILPKLANVPDGQVELYDLESDPHETKNLAADNTARVAAMRSLINGWWSAR